MNTLLIGIIIFVIVYLFLNWFARTSSKKIATTIKKTAVYFSLILVALLTLAGKYIYTQANERPLLYGIICVVIAWIAGLSVAGLSRAR